MIDFTKKIKNSNKFRQPAIRFEETGSYCPYPKGTTEYFEFWQREREYSINGYTAPDGDYITGYHYFYLNYCPIVRMIDKVSVLPNGKTKVSKFREKAFADFYDYDYYYFQAIQLAEESNKHLCVAKSRRKGYSYKGGAMLCRNFFLIPNSKSYVYASNKQYLTDDGILTKAWDFMDFIDEHTAWGKKRQMANTSMRRRASFIVTDEYGNKVEAGYKSEIIGVSLKDNPDVVRGKAAKLILFEEAGSFPELVAAWQVARPSVEHDGIAFGLMIMFGTGGDEGAAIAALKGAFYDPDSYNCLGFTNIWDDGINDKPCGFFIPQHTNLDVKDEDGNRLFMDEDGNTKHKEAIKYILDLREKELSNATDSRAVDRYIAERCQSPMEAFMELSGNIFPKKDLQQHLAKIRTNRKLQNHKQVGDLVYVEGQLQWIPKKKGDILRYTNTRKADEDMTGSIVIWEHPMIDAPFGLYVSGCLTPGEKVLTDIGLMNVEDIDHSRKLVSKDGNYVSINTLLRYEKQDERIYEMKVSNTFRTTKFTGEHPIYISKPNLKSNRTINEAGFEFDFVRMRDVEEGDWIKVPNLYKKEIDCSDKEFIEDPSFYRFLGMWLGDGWCQNDGRIHMSFNASEYLYMYEYIALIKRLFNRSVYYRKRNNCYECSFCMKDLAKYLHDNFGKGASGKCLPEWVKYTSDERKHALILGYLDTDGCITKHTKGYYSMEFVSINLELLEGIQDIAFSIGLISNLSILREAKTQKLRGTTINSKACYHLRFGNHDTINFAQRFKEVHNTKLEKVCLNDIVSYKRNKQGCFFDENQNYIYFQIKKIEQSLYTGKVYNFDCDTHTFMCHHITTHNCDPYDHDQAGTNSLGSIFIYKRFQSIEEYHDIIVAEYTGRPNTAEDFYENVRKLLLYYNARLLYENQNKGLFSYFVNKHCDYLLADQPSILNDIVATKTTVNRRKGCHMTKEIKLWGEGLIKEWLIEEIAPGVPRLTTILSEPLLEELIAYNDKGNFDRVMAFMQVMIYREQLYNLQIKEKKEIERNISLFDRPLFQKESYETNFFNNDNIPIFRF